MSVTRKPDGKWLARPSVKGRRLKSRTFDRKADAQAWHDAQLTDLRRGDWVDPRRNPPFSQIADEWFQSKQAGWSERTRENRTISIGHVPDDPPVQHIDFMMVQQWVNRVAESNGATAADHMLAVIRQVLDFAVRAGMVKRNVATDVERPAHAPKKREFLTPPELDRLVAQLPREYQPFTLMMAFTGLRIGEASTLTGEHIDQINGRLLVRNLKTRKKREPHWIPLAAPIRQDVLERARGGGLMYHNTMGNPVSRDSYRQTLASATKRAGIDKRITPHSLRHTCASWLIRSGADVKRVAEWLGHDPAETLRTYAHLFPNDLGSLAEMLDDMWQERVTPLRKVE